MYKLNHIVSVTLAVGSLLTIIGCSGDNDSYLGTVSRGDGITHKCYTEAAYELCRNGDCSSCEPHGSSTSSQEKSNVNQCTVSGNTVLADEGTTCTNNGDTLSCKDNIVTLKNGGTLTAPKITINGTVYTCQ